MIAPYAFTLLLLTPAEEFQKGTALLDLGRPAEAIPHLESAARQAESNALYWKAVGVAYARLEDYRGALEPFGKACGLDPRLSDACYYYGRALYAADRYRDALEPLRRALRGDPIKSRVDAALGQCHEALGDSALAEKRFRAAMARKQDPGREMARLAYARFLTRQGRPGEAAALLRASNSDAPEVFYELGLALYQDERLEEAVTALQRAASGQAAGSPAQLLLDRALRRIKAR
ncbi:MAG: tetratricopeptide repeat protein [Bryobacteraceae bacterium]|nr:tetratricopeptide repeat protein [Bryobacteraceae bacterium]